MIVTIVMYLLICLSIISADGVGPEPWDSKFNRRSEELKENNDPMHRKIVLDDDRICHENCDQGAWFYKMLLRFILQNGNFKDDKSGCMEGLLQFKIPISNFKQIQKLINSDSKITKDGYRLGNEFIMESLVVSKYDYLRETFFTRISMAIKEYYMYALYGVTIVLFVHRLIWLYQRMVFNAKFFIICGAILIFSWEVIILLKEAEETAYLRLKNDLTSCSYYFWQSDCYVTMPSITEWWEKFHPGVIMMRIITRFFYNPLTWFLQDVVRKLSDELMWPFNKLSYIGLSMVTIFTLFFMSISFMANFIFRKPVTMGLLFNMLTVSLGNSEKRRKRSDVHMLSNSSNMDRISGDNLKSLLMLSNRLVDASVRDESNPSTSFGTNVKCKRSQSMRSPKPIAKSSSEGNLRELHDQKIQTVCPKY